MKHGSRGVWPVVASLVDIRCPDRGETERFGAWIVSDPAPGLPEHEVDLAGTPADPDAIRMFMSFFRPCRAGS